MKRVPKEKLLVYAKKEFNSPGASVMSDKYISNLITKTNEHIYGKRDIDAFLYLVSLYEEEGKLNKYF